MIRRSVALLLLVAALSACGAGSHETPDGALSTERDSAGAAARIEGCVDRFLLRATTQGANEDATRRYVRDTYCAKFEKSGWIYDDGVLRIGAQTWLEEGATCNRSRRAADADCAVRGT